MKTVEALAVFLNWSDEDECYVARIPALPGCLTHGECVESALKAAGEAAATYLEVEESTDAAGLTDEAPNV